jgi:undecaprenyl diphosphate synthase
MSPFKEKIDLSKVPVHVAIIMDGNGRWAKKRGLDRIFGHQSGVESVREVTEAAAEIGVKYLTLYTFSTENWGRPQSEVDALMELLIDTIEKETPTLDKNNISLLSIGDIERLPGKSSDKLKKCIKETSPNTGLKLVLALSYSSRWEIKNAVKKIVSDVKLGILDENKIDDNIFSTYLTTNEIPDPDLLIRTSGEQRVSNFLLWQIAYSELYFTTTHWPDFRKDAFFEAIYEFQQRERRFGK